GRGRVNSRRPTGPQASPDSESPASDRDVVLLSRSTAPARRRSIPRISTFRARARQFAADPPHVSRRSTPFAVLPPLPPGGRAPEQPLDVPPDGTPAPPERLINRVLRPACPQPRTHALGRWRRPPFAACPLRAAPGLAAKAVLVSVNRLSPPQED